ncbi:hypothetical protein F7Q99_16855 [Streptomyces kaniharaensis]|uniref:Uncharacterized protein n=1 Tax=Streptomyces kaniharaensis TaxID=212423 RepID=A0A6N7KWE0_9ACTN|nr:hypothetical protein [Streptomyces kaniharaensis]MQS13893.1 hypothetical protein [Streptomyces kaniharaensis]
MLVESIVFAVVGLATGLTALLALPAYFPAGRGLTLGTALAAALVGGVVAHFCLAGHYPAVTIGASAVASAVLTSALARPDLAAGRAPEHRHHPHRAGAHRPQRRHRPA